MAFTPRALRNRLWPLLIGLAVALATVLVSQIDDGPVGAAIKTGERFYYDQKVRSAAALDWASADDETVVIVDVDERSLSEIGRWPWPRATVAELLDALWEAGVVIAAFDMVFAEPERNPAERVASATEDEQLHQALKELAPRLDGDHRLAESLGAGETVLGYFLHTDRDNGQSGALPEPARTEIDASGRPLAVPRLPAYTGNRALLQEAADGAGFFTALPDGDGVVRRAPLVLGHRGALYPTLALESVRLFQLLEDFELATERQGSIRAIDAVELGDRSLPTDERGQLLVPYRGPPGTMPSVSAAEILHGNVDSADLEGRIAVIGTTALGLYDLRPTPVGSAFPGVEIHATLISAMLSDEPLPQRPSWASGAELIAVVLSGMIAAVLLPFLAPWAAVVAATALGGVLLGTDLWLWQQHRIVLEQLPALAAVGLVLFANLGWGFAFEYRRRRQLRQRFGEYVPPQLVEQMAEQPGAYHQAGETREITVLFADIRGFTTISEQLDAAQLKDLLNRFFTPMTRVIFEQGGTIDKYVGDMIMAFWGAPVDDPDHRQNAVAAALAMLEEAQRLGPIFEAEGLPTFEIGIGLNSGRASVGDMGSEYRRAYTALGDTVNLAARVESVTKDYGLPLLISENTAAGLDAELPVREVDRIQVKGREAPVTLFTIDQAGLAPLDTRLIESTTICGV